MNSEKDSMVLIDDDRWLLELYGEKFKAEGFIVHTATNGRDGYDLALKLRPTMIISDVVMSGGDGFELLRKVRHNSELKHLLFIGLTNLSSNKDQLELETLGADAFIVKVDFTPTQAVERVKLLIERTRGAANRQLSVMS